MSRRIAFSRPTANETEQLSLFEHYSLIGYEGLQLKRSQFAPYIEKPERFLEKWGDLPGVGSALIFGGTLDEADIAALRRLYRFAEKIGTELIVYCHGVPRNQVSAEDIRSYARTLSELGKEARQHGLSLSLHHHFNQPVMHREDFDLFFDAIPDGAVGLTIDTAHLVKSGIHNAAEVITSFARMIDNFHLKDYSNGDWRVLGEGEIDFEPIFRAIRQVNYSGWLSADEESGGDIVGGMRSCLAYLQRSHIKEMELGLSE